jgi:monofunctional biosynthetic peptidoglycan transglycosylase
MALNIKSRIRGGMRAYKAMPLWKRILWGIGVVWAAFTLFSVVLTILMAFIPVIGTPLMVIRAVEGNRVSKEVLWKKDWVGGNKLSDHLKLAVICAEDQNFLEHHGFDLVAIEKALKHNKKSRRKRGASTISQQTAKNVFLWPGRSWFRKGLEVWFTALIEIFWSKQRILTVYLNIAEMGKGIYGAEAAAQHYFRKPAAKLNRSEAALLASVLPSPMRYSVSNPGPYVRNRQAWILRQMQMQGGVSTMRAHPNW